MWFGYGLQPKIVIAFLTAFFPIVIATVAGLVSLEPEMVHLVRSMGASGTQTFMKLRLPAALPSIFAGLKIGIGLAVIGAIIGEYVSSDAGLGYRQLTANSHFDSSLNFAALFVIAMTGIVTFGAMQLLEHVMIRVR
jgi:NitT/TauT family transport system permease protein